MLIGGAGEEIQSGGEGEPISVTGFETVEAGTRDGVYGPMTEDEWGEAVRDELRELRRSVAANALFTATQLANEGEVLDDNFIETWDEVTNERIQSLHPRIREMAERLVDRVECELGIKLRVTGGMRTIEEQNALYEQGRTRPGPVVTWVRGGSSYHNYGLAMDVGGITAEGNLTYDLDWEAVAAIGREIGFEWGGDWTNNPPDRPHFQFTYGADNRAAKSAV